MSIFLSFLFKISPVASTSNTLVWVHFCIVSLSLVEQWWNGSHYYYHILIKQGMVKYDFKVKALLLKYFIHD